MAGKYPTPEQAVSNFLGEVSKESTQRKWGERAAAGAEKLRDYFETALPAVYRVVSGFTSKHGKTIEEIVKERVVPVAEAVSRSAEEYRKKKIREIAGLARE